MIIDAGILNFDPNIIHESIKIGFKKSHMVPLFQLQISNQVSIRSEIVELELIPKKLMNDAFFSGSDSSKMVSYRIPFEVSTF